MQIMQFMQLNDTNMIKTIFTYFIIIFILDAIVLTLLKQTWNTTIVTVQKETFNPKITYAFFSYILMTFGVYYFVYRHIRKNDWIRDTLVNGFLFGFVLYGVFDMTNLAIFTKYSFSTALIDMIWGSTLMATSTFLTYYLLNK